ncbi:hypothetical protein M408DRAFT_28381 [Serendipita vermifera MAFF 305830]|uniref:G-patch domain-containing protein n=1 Tax=Serendipita vermifera MAFF 305830 TaxID=933852 RepID=A0A0C2WZW9_SERVB|nr:hypothetical protein M408DRAFT_28381 [Serendipita vermifera MAFF 305830]
MAHLRKRLGNAGVDLNSPKVNESFVLIGTPLPPLEKTKDNNEFVPLWKQEVRDEQGRRRLHGAFTGGFSAGYFNTVGSKEGWAPSTFKSSRNDRSKNKAMRPEDFMDEEDMAEMQEGRKLVDQDEAADMPDTRGLLQGENDSISAALANMLPPINESVGAQLLKKMGWRPGQGIGPRLTYEQMKKRSEQDGNPLPPVEDAEAKKHTYAPRDTKPLNVSRKDDFHGLGYQSVTGLRSSGGASAEGPGPRISAGFGLGALNEADDDDVDVYDSGLPSGGRRLAFEAGDEDDDRPRKKASTSSSNPKFQSAGFFKNGVPLLSGFVIVDIPVPEAKKFNAPEVPPNWTPDPNRAWGSTQDASTSNTTAPAATTSHHQWKTGITADERGSILGEEQLPAAKPSVWDYLSAKDRERLQGFKEGQNTPKPGPVQPPPVQVIDVPRTDPAIAKAALMGFQPFKDDPRKQTRYTAYLGSQASSQPMQLQPSPGQSIADFNAELEGFAQAARIFKPMSTAMANRFRSSTGVETTAQPQEGLYQPTEEAYAQHEAKTVGAEKMQLEETPKEHAAKMGMYGTMTREQSDWMPAKLLCKRFRVPPPKISASDAAGDDSNTGQHHSSPYPAPPSSSMDIDVADEGEHIRVVTSENAGTGDGSGKRDMANIGLGEDDTQGRETLTYERPAMDIFKAIFASDEEDSEDEAERNDPLQQSGEHSHSQPGNIASATQPNLADPVVSAHSGPVDLANFRPTFVARSHKPALDKVADKPAKAKKKSKSHGPVSFMEDDDVGLTVVPTAKKRKRDKDQDGKSSKKKRDKEMEEANKKPINMVVDEEDDEMWVEKAEPTIVHQLPPAPAATNETASIPTGKSRPRASDFL